MVAAPAVLVDDVVAWIRAQSAPASLRFGSPHPTVLVAFDGARWTLHSLHVEPEALITERDRRLAAGKAFMPEHAAAIAEPRAAVLTATTSEAFVAQLQALTWTSAGPVL